MSNKAKRTNQKEKKKMSKKTKIIIVSIVLIILGIIGGIIISFMSRYNYNQLDLTDLGLNEDTLGMEKRSQYKNIALFGVDSRANTFDGLSDTIMVVTLDYEHNKIKMSSFLRDTLVRVDKQERNCI